MTVVDTSESAELPDLSSCDREPIQFLGSIQPFAALIEVSADWLITRISANAPEFLDVDPEAALGRPLVSVLGGHLVHQIRGLLQVAAPGSGVQHMFDVSQEGGSGSFDLAVHRLAETIVIELERHDPSGARVAAAIQPLIMNLRHLDTLDRLCTQVARQVRALTGFDRVMIYQFQPDGSGEVIAETKRSDMPPYAGLRYPASDIPQQARALYLKNTIRLIADVGAPNVPVLPSMDPDGAPLDLSLTGARAVSPIHIEYLRNMGVCASMSISIVAGDKLWGLIACHHRTPRVLSAQSRASLEFFGQMFSTMLQSQLRLADLALREAARTLHATILSALGNESASLDDIVPHLRTVQLLLAADGVASFVEGRLRLSGTTPTEQQSLDLMQFLNRSAAGRIYSTHALSSVYPEAASYAKAASGLMAVPVSRKPRDFVVFFRRELIQVVGWAGEPAKSVERSEDGLRLSPRKSFETWKETVVRQSQAWTESDYAMSEALRVTLIEFMLQVTDRAEKQRKASNEQQDLLIAELNHRVRNILNLIVGLVRQCSERAESVPVLAEEISARVRALARAHDQLTSGGWGARSVINMIRVEAGAYLGDRADRVRIVGKDVQIYSDAFSTLALVMHEMITNAAKYGGLSDSSGQVEIQLQHDGTTGLLIDWRESGGPPVREPTRRGFGSTIIERAIPHELGGLAEIRFLPEGIAARFIVPARYVTDAVMLPTQVADTARPAPTPADRIRGTVLLVEDNLLIALETEDSLQTLGADDVHIASTVAAALSFLGEARPDFAVLDYNLGREQSVQVAERLQTDGVPFVFATGYGDSATIDQRFRSRPIITKPYTARSLLDAFNAAMALA